MASTERAQGRFSLDRGDVSTSAVDFEMRIFTSTHFYSLIGINLGLHQNGQG